MTAERDWYQEHFDAAFFELINWSNKEGSGLALTLLFFDWAKEAQPALYSGMRERRARIDELMRRKEPGKEDDLYDVLVGWMETTRKADLLYRDHLRIRKLSPPFIERHGAGYSHALEHLEAEAAKVESWASSYAGFGSPVPYRDFWAWFKLKKAYEKFGALEDELERTYKSVCDPEARDSFDSLVKRWVEAVKSAVIEFKEFRKKIQWR